MFVCVWGGGGLCNLKNRGKRGNLQHILPKGGGAGGKLILVREVVLFEVCQCQSLYV